MTKLILIAISALTAASVSACGNNANEVGFVGSGATRSTQAGGSGSGDGGSSVGGGGSAAASSGAAAGKANSGGSGSGGSDGGATSGGSGGADMGGAAGSAGSAATETFQCWSNPTQAVFRKDCQAASDCFVAEQWVGCCSVDLSGLNIAEQTAVTEFNAFDGPCGGVPPCGCCCDTLTAEDGAMVSRTDPISVDCVDGICRSFVP